MNIRRALRTLISYWRWWRLAIAGVAIGALVGAVVVDTAVVAATFATLSVVSLAQLVALSGTRVDRHHRELESLTMRTGALSARIDGVARDAARAGSLRPGDLSLLLPLQPRSDSVHLVRALADAIPAAEVVVIDRTGTSTIGTDLVRAMTDRSNVSYLASSPSKDIVDDMNEAAALSAGTFVVPLSRHTTRQDLSTIVALAASMPTRSDPPLGARFSSLDGRFCLVNAQALAEVGGFVDAAGPSGDLMARLRAGGHSVDRGTRTSSDRSRRLHAGRLDPPLLVGTGHDLAGAVVILAGSAPAAHMLAERTTEFGAEECVWLCPGDAWPEIVSVVLRTRHRAFLLPTPGEWLDDVQVIVAAENDDHPGVRHVVDVVTDGPGSRVLQPDHLEAAEVLATVRGRT